MKYLNGIKKLIPSNLSYNTDENSVNQDYYFLLDVSQDTNYFRELDFHKMNLYNKWDPNQRYERVRRSSRQLSKTNTSSGLELCHCVWNYDVLSTFIRGFLRRSWKMHSNKKNTVKTLKRHSGSYRFWSDSQDEPLCLNYFHSLRRVVPPVWFTRSFGIILNSSEDEI